MGHRCAYRQLDTSEHYRNIVCLHDKHKPEVEEFSVAAATAEAVAALIVALVRLLLILLTRKHF